MFFAAVTRWKSWLTRRTWMCTSQREAGMLKRIYPICTRLEKCMERRSRYMMRRFARSRRLAASPSSSWSKYAGLTSPDLQSLVAGRKWTDFLDVVQAIIEDLNRLCGVAVTYQKEGRRGDGREDETLTEEQRAYRILGVPAGVSPEQIKKQYQSLAQLWHPDKGMVRDDQRMKEINWAYEFLKDLRRF